MTFFPILYACGLFSLLSAFALNLLGLKWYWSILVAVFLAAAVGWAALDTLGPL